MNLSLYTGTVAVLRRLSLLPPSLAAMLRTESDRALSNLREVCGVGSAEGVGTSRNPASLQKVSCLIAVILFAGFVPSSHAAYTRGLDSGNAVSITNTSAFAYTQYTYHFTATLTTTWLEFFFRQDPGFWSLDDISCTKDSSPGMNLVQNGGFETGNGHNWYGVVTKGLMNAGVWSGNGGHTGPACWNDYATGGVDGVAQGIPTTVGQHYTLTFWLKNQGDPTHGDTVNSFDANVGAKLTSWDGEPLTYNFLRISPTALPNSTARAAGYSQMLSVSRASGTVTYTVTSGTLPTGLTLTAGGKLAGTPTVSGTFNFTVTAKDSTAGTGTQDYTITIDPFTQSPASMDGYSKTITSIGGKGSVNFAVTAGKVPTGLKLSPDGILAGRLAGSGTFAFTVTGKDSVGTTGSKAFIMAVTPSANLGDLTLSSGTLDTPFTPNGTSYTATVPSQFVTITPTPEDLNSTVAVQVNGGAFTKVVSGAPIGPVALTLGIPWALNVKVTKVDGITVKTYTLTLTRVLSTNPNLVSLTPSAGAVPTSFFTGTSAVVTAVPNSTNSITFTPMTADMNATLFMKSPGGGYKVIPSGKPTSAVPLILGDNLIEFWVSSEIGMSATRYYSLTIHRVSLPVLSPPTALTANEVTLNATVDTLSTSARFQYGLTNAYGMKTLPAPCVPGFNASITDLAPATVYHYRAAVTTGTVVEYSPDAVFVTNPTFVLNYIARQGNQAPGVSGTVINYSAFGNPAINDLDDVAFQAVLSGSGITTANNTGIWMKAGSSTSLIVRTGTATAFLSGSTVQSGTFTALTGDPVLNNKGQVAFLGTVKSGTATYQGIWATGTNGELVQMVRTQAILLDTSANTIASFAQFVLTDQGSLAFLANLTVGIGGVTPTTSLALGVVDASGQFHPLHHVGSTLTTGTARITAFSIFASPAGVGGQTRSFNTNGELMFMLALSDGTQGIYTISPSDWAFTPVDQTHDSAPVASGSASFATFGCPIVNDSSKEAFQAVITGSGISAAQLNNTGIWAESGTSATLLQVARIGVPQSYAGSISGTAMVTGTFTALGNPVFNADDQVAFMGTVKTGKPATSYQGIWATGTSGELFLVTQAQAQAPDCPTGAKFSTFAQLVLPDQGGPVFVANLASGAGGITTGNSQGIWAVDTNGRINLVARTGDAVVIDGKTKFIKSLSIFATSAATVGQTRSFNASGDLIYKVAFTDNTQAIIQIVFP